MEIKEVEHGNNGQHDFFKNKVLTFLDSELRMYTETKKFDFSQLERGTCLFWGARSKLETRIRS